MRKCELCGAEIANESKACSRCGFEFQMEIRADSRDKALLERHAGMDVDEVKRELKNIQAKLTAYLDNMAAKSLSKEELVSVMDESLKYLQIPLALSVDDELRFEESEIKFIELISGCLANADSQNNRPVGSKVTYIKMSNALMALGRQGEAVDMIEKALLINPRDRDALYCKAALLFNMQKYDAAKKCLEKLISSGDREDARYLSELINQLDRHS
jgi:tetratricopeptide (TPR) repeat protein